jgi:hypothetical protein
MNIDDRMKRYEAATRYQLTTGKSFLKKFLTVEEE